MNPRQRLQRINKRNLLVISAASLHSGVQFLYLHTRKDSWSVSEYQVSPYLQKIRSGISNLLNGSIQTHTLKEFSRLDQHFSIFLLDSTRSFLSLLPRHAQKPDLIVLHSFALWNDFTEDDPDSRWNISLGDPQILASGVNSPVLTDFIRHDILNKGDGRPPIIEGDKRIAQPNKSTTVFINIGLLSQVTIIGRNSIIDSHSGPGTCLINKAAKEIGTAEGFDRDGSLAQTGVVDTDCLEQLATSEWFQKPAPKFTKPDYFDALYNQQCLQKLSSLDRLSTVTALSSRTISNFYKKEIRGFPQPEVIYISGGGVNNTMLTELLSAYLSPIHVEPVEEIGIPTEGRIPLALGLTVDTALSKRTALRLAKNKEHYPLGKWVFP
ncbi:MAG: anhydro-N-acetylmuramic acid kinase [Fibrobacterota bacterium]